MNEINEENPDNALNSNNNFEDIINIGYFFENNNDILIPFIQKNNSKSLFFYFYNKEKIFNEKGTKLEKKDNLLDLIYILNQYIKRNDDFIFIFFKKINVDILKVIINAYIIFELNEKDKKEIYIFIKKFISFFFDKNIVNFIYKKLSKIFRKFSLFKDKKILYEQFSNILDIWKLLYKIKDISKVNEFYIALIGRNKLLVDLSKFKKKSKINTITVTIEFAKYFPLYLNEKLKNFFFFKAYFNKENPKELKICDMEENDLINMNKIKIKLTQAFISYNINENGFNDENPTKFIRFILKNDTEIEKVEILNNYVGKIKNVQVILEYNNNKNKLEYELALNEKEDKEKCYKIINIESNDKEEKLQMDFLPDNKNYIESKMMNEIYYEDIRYYGGMESFIPIFKIIKYFIVEFKDYSKIITNLNKIIINIMKIMIKSICYNKKNFINFKTILGSLIGSLAEINHVLPENFQKELYNNQIFSLFYILIVSSSIPLAKKKAYIMVTGLNEVEKLNLNFDDIIIDINFLEISCFQWYFIIIYVFIEFILLVYNDYNKIPKKIFEQLINIYNIGNNKVGEEREIMLLFRLLIEALNYICAMKDEENIFNKFNKINDISQFLEDNSDIFNKSYAYYLYSILIIVKVYFNLIDFELILNDDEKEQINDDKDNIIINEEQFKNQLNSKTNHNNPYHHIYKLKYIKLFDSLEKIFGNSYFIDEKQKSSINYSFKDFTRHKTYLEKIFHLNDTENFTSESENIIKEFTDYHGEYHKLMKNLFIFNRIWSDKKLYYNQQNKSDYLKYKSINYYTTNYLRPLLFPVNDYKYTYPTLSDYEIKKGFYLTDENLDDYNFNLDCPELDDFSIKYEQEIIEKIEKDYQMIMQSYNVCLVKRTHHIKGKLYCILNESRLITKFLFYSFPYDIAKDTPCCNVVKGMQHLNHKKEKLCFGESLVCPKREMNKKLVISIKNVRLILKRIYFYRKTAIEIFTKTKSYFINFAEDNNIEGSNKGSESCMNIIQMMGFYYKNDFFPIKIKDELIGYSKDFAKIVQKYVQQKNKKYDLMEVENKFISLLFDHYKPSEKNPEYSSLDMIMYLNLLSNRSYIDIFQYPVFPLLFLYEKNTGNDKYKYIERSLDQHIGFQEISKKSKNRKDMINITFTETIKENQFEPKYEEVPVYFKTHYSNNVYTCNYLLRLFPYCFLAIEFQGNDFDNPNRLFSAIEDTFYNISYQKSDIRELIPEFFYFPEIFMNINKINFGKKANGKKVDDVEMPKDLINKDIINENNNSILDENEKTNYFLSFKLIEKNRNLLESKTNDINNWINLIFGTETKYKDYKKKDQLFRTESYIDYSAEKEEEFSNYVKDKDIMCSVDFGISPVQTLFKKQEILFYSNRNSIYDKKVKENKELSQSIYNDFMDTIEGIKEKDEKKKNNNNIDSERNSRVSYYNRFSKLVENINNKHDNNRYSSKKIIKFYHGREKIELKGYKSGKVDVFIMKTLYDELYDHNGEITCIYYNQRLNMFCTTSKDGYLNVYMYPNKLISSLKNQNGYFNMAFLSSNPFPSIIAFEEKNYEISSYSINGFLIKKVSVLKLLGLKEKKSELEIYHKFNENGGTYKDRLIFIEEKIKGKYFKCQLFTLPFFDREEKKYEIKKKMGLF